MTHAFEAKQLGQQHNLRNLAVALTAALLLMTAAATN